VIQQLKQSENSKDNQIEAQGEEEMFAFTPLPQEDLLVSLPLSWKHRPTLQHLTFPHKF